MFDDTLTAVRAISVHSSHSCPYMKSTVPSAAICKGGRMQQHTGASLLHLSTTHLNMGYRLTANWQSLLVCKRTCAMSGTMGGVAGEGASGLPRWVEGGVPVL